ncbi:MAG: hypothetical protein WKG07_33105 [Hymenobacter sp.]
MPYFRPPGPAPDPALVRDLTAQQHEHAPARARRAPGPRAAPDCAAATRRFRRPTRFCRCSWC